MNDNMMQLKQARMLLMRAHADLMRACDVLAQLDRGDQAMAVFSIQSQLSAPILDLSAETGCHD